MKKGIVAALLFSSFLSYASPDADSILTAVRDRDDGQSYVSDVELNLINSDGNVRARNMYMLQKDTNDKEMTYIYFYDSVDVRGVSFLMYTYQEQTGSADDQWLYLPAFRKIRRIGSNDKRGSFMGSTFSYYDLDKIRVGDYQSTVVGEETIDGRDTWVIEQIPSSQEVINKTGYYKVTRWVDKEREIFVRSDYFDAKDVLFKRQEAIEVEAIQGIWTVTNAKTSNFVNNTSSEMIFNKLEYNVGLDNKKFSKRALKNGLKISSVAEVIQGDEG
ncbi:outer membrane lipoprotein-sorting protein [Photobacterium sp. DNB22_13_2]